MKSVLTYLALALLISAQLHADQISMDDVVTHIRPQTNEFNSSLFPGISYETIQHPTIGLALSGGGLKGIAHIGVLQALQEAGIPIDYITGTSAGSIVGGLYALGYSVEEIDSIARAINYETIFIDQPQRRNLFVNQKATASRYLLDLRFDDWRPYIPISLTAGQAISEQLTALHLRSTYSTIRDFDKLRVPFRAVATELETGKRQVLQSGGWTEAIRASSSVPMVLSPVQKGDMRLIDGGVADNIPIDLTKEIGADFVIAVDVRAKLYKPNQLENLLLVADQVINILMNASRQEVIDNADVVITPDFDAELPEAEDEIDASIQRGYLATKQDIDTILEQYNRLLNPSGDKYEIDSVYFSGNESLSKDNLWEISRLNETSGRRVFTNGAIDTTLNYLVRSGYFADTEALIHSQNGTTSLEFWVQENPTVRVAAISGVTALDSLIVSRTTRTMLQLPYNPRMLEYLLGEIIRQYRNTGFAFAKVDTVEWNPDSGVLQIGFSEGRLGRITYQGNTYTKNYVLSREIRLKPGDLIRVNSVQRTLTNLYSTELFEHVGVDFVPIPDTDRWDMVVRVQEEKYIGVRFGYHVDNQRGDAGVFALENQNFQGNGTQLVLETKIGQMDRYGLLSYTSNRFLKTYLTYQVSLENSWKQFDIYDMQLPNQSPDYVITRNRASFSLGHQIAKLGLVNVLASYQDVRISGPEDRPRLNNHYALSTITLQSIVDSKDQADFPSAGYYHKILYEMGLEALGGDKGYTKFEFAANWYITFIKRHTIHAGIDMNLGDQALPFSEWFYLGGLDSFMGLNEYEEYGTKLYLGHLEYRYRIPVSSLFDMHLFIKYDVAAITTDVLYKISPEDFFHGGGIGIGASTPAGPVRFAYGKTRNYNDAFYFYIGWDF